MHVCPSGHLFVPPISSKKELRRKKNNIKIYSSWRSKTGKIADLLILKHLALDIDRNELENCLAETHSSVSPMMEGRGQGVGKRP
jgi:hypothetical protein